MKHTINHLSFGKRDHQKAIYDNYGKTMNYELDGTGVLAQPFRNGQLYVEYVLDITEVEYSDTTR